jgi:hypothetical protein
MAVGQGHPGRPPYCDSTSGADDGEKESRKDQSWLEGDTNLGVRTEAMDCISLASRAGRNCFGPGDRASRLRFLLVMGP